ncbi:MAG: glycosyltransferase [Prevotellaceae bacterium]|jgi:glycosyltransferase involved in cell wall biosynthesis|nr:glycosyltransferase [Prevotellaceae bacterium]
MENSKKISVIIPCYNGEKYIAKCLENLLSQTCKSLEIIVVNDGSKDKSLDIIQKFKDLRFQNLVIINQANRGLSAARNAGIDCATGDYIHFFDVDDEVNDVFFENMLSAIVGGDADIACGGMINEPSPRKNLIYSKLEILTTTADKLEKTKVGRWGYVWRYLFKMDFLKHHNLRFEEGRFIEDLPFTLPAVYFAEKLAIVPDAIYTYKLQENSIMTTNDFAHRRKRFRDWQHVKTFRKEFANAYNFEIPDVATHGFKALIIKYFG